MQKVVDGQCEYSIAKLKHHKRIFLDENTCEKSKGGGH